MHQLVRRIERDPGEINITAFMNLMVILVPFLLITAVFSRIVVLELNLPPAAEAKAKPAKKFQLEVTVRKDQLVVADRNGGVIKRIRNTGDGYNYGLLSKVLTELKSRFPSSQDAMILAESSTSYNTLVQVMDAVRMVEVITAGSVVKYELFPEIGIGDAPAKRRK